MQNAVFEKMRHFVLTNFLHWSIIYGETDD